MLLPDVTARREPDVVPEEKSMGRFLRLWKIVALATLLGACDERSPSGPTVVTTTPTGPVNPAVRTIRGIVVDQDDRTVAGAEVTFGSQRVATTDAAGAFEFSIGQDPRISPAVSVVVEKPGYEPSWGWAGTQCCERVRLYEIREIAVGQSVTLTLFNEAYCGLFMESPCRRVRIRSSSPGTLTVRVEPESFGVLPAESSGLQGLPQTLSVAVGPQTETSVDVWASGSWDGQGTGRSFTLTSSVQ